MGILESAKEEKLPPLVFVVHVQIPIEGIFSRTNLVASGAESTRNYVTA
jgi:hypothetical protein